jgi:cation transporter-like permease
VLKYSREGYQQAWRNLPAEQLSAELASLFHMLAGRAHRKHDSLRHLYGGLVVLLALGATMFLLAGLFTLLGQPY